MTTKLFDRIATLLKADAHGVIESLEERSLLLKQCVREAEIELNRKRARLEIVRDEAKRLREAIARSEEEARSLDEDVALALAGGKEELARFAARRLLARQRAADALRVQLAARGDEEAALAERFAAQQAQFDSLRTRVRAELARRSATDEPGAWTCERAVADEEVELELLRRRREHTEEGGR
jgi:phage shock protein A